MPRYDKLLVLDLDETLVHACEEPLDRSAEHGILDDSPEKLERSYGNLVRVAPYEGRADDREPPLLLRYLDELGPIEDVRRVEKRGWSARFSGS